MTKRDKPPHNTDKNAVPVGTGKILSRANFQ